MLYFFAIAGGTLTNSTVINNSFPIFATIAAAIFLKEKITPGVLISLLIAWLGVGLLVHPNLNQLFWPDILALISAVLAGIAIVVVRELRRRDESSWSVFFYLSFFGLFGSAVFAIPVWVWPSFLVGSYALVAGIFGLVAQVTMTSAYKYCRTAVGGILSMSTMVFTTLIGIIILGEKLSMGEAAGGLLVGLGSVAVLWYNSKSSEKCET